MKTSDDTMITPSTPIDLKLAEEVIERIPAHTWSDVCNTIITNIVDEMPSAILEHLTGSKDDFVCAEEILRNYYVMPDLKQELIIDAFKILGEENTLYILDALKLDEIQEPTDEMPEM